MENENNIDIDSYQRFIQKLQYLEINLNGLQKGYEKDLKNASITENKEDLKNKINKIVALTATLSSLCKEVSSTSFNNMRNEILQELFRTENSVSCGKFFYKIQSSMALLDRLKNTKEASQDIKNLINFLTELDSDIDPLPDHIKRAGLRLKQYLVLTAIEKLESLEEELNPLLKITEIKRKINNNTTPFSEKKTQLGIALKEYCFTVAEQQDYCTDIILLTKKFLNDSTDCLSPYSADLLEIIYNKIMDNSVKDKLVTGLIEEIIGEKTNYPKKPRKRLFSDDDAENPAPSPKSTKTHSPQRSNSPPGMTLSDLADISTNSVPTQLPKVTFKPPKKRPREDYDASDEEDNESHCRSPKR